LLFMILFVPEMIAFLSSFPLIVKVVFLAILYFKL
jgi:hypothetical protein